MKILLLCISILMIVDASFAQVSPGRKRESESNTVFLSDLIFKKPKVKDSAAGRVEDNREIDAAIKDTSNQDLESVMSIPNNASSISIDNASQSPSGETKAIRNSPKTSAEVLGTISEQLGVQNAMMAMTDPSAAEAAYRAGQFGNEKAGLANDICAADPTNVQAAGLNQASLTERTKQIIASNAAATGNGPMSFAEGCEESIREAIEMNAGKSILAFHPAHPKMLPILLTEESIDRDPSEIRLTDILMNRKLAELANSGPDSPAAKVRKIIRKAHAHLTKFSGDIIYKVDPTDTSKIQIINQAPNTPASKRFKELRDENYNDLAFAAMVVCEYQNLGNYDDQYVPFTKSAGIPMLGGISFAVPNNIWTKLKADNPNLATDLEVALQNLSFEGFQMDLEIPTAINQLFIMTEKPVGSVAVSGGQMLGVDCSKLDPNGDGKIENIENKMKNSQSVNTLSLREQYLLGISNYITRLMVASEAEFIYSVMYQAYVNFAPQDDAYKINAIESLRGLLVTSFLEQRDRLQGRPFGEYKTESMLKMAALIKELDTVLGQQRGSQGKTLAGFVGNGSPSGNPLGSQ